MIVYHEKEIQFTRCNTLTNYDVISISLAKDYNCIFRKTNNKFY